MDDKEIQALASLSSSFEQLDQAAIKRVLDWAAAKFNVTIGAAHSKEPAAVATSSARGSEEFASFADLFDATNPATDKEKVLVAAYWLQEVEGNKEWASQPANDALKNLGHPLSNVTRALGEIQNSKPTLVMQTQKSGKSKQARKLYKLTAEGIKAVRKLLSGAKLEDPEQ